MMFRKKTSTYNTISDQMFEVHDFKLRSCIGFESYLPAEYHTFYKLRDEIFFQRIDQALENLFKGKPDKSNSDMVSDVILGPVLEAFPDLDRQRCYHLDTIRRMNTRGETDPKDLIAIRHDRQKELEQMEAQLRYIQFLMAQAGRGVPPDFNLMKEDQHHD